MRHLCIAIAAAVVLLAAAIAGRAGAAGVTPPSFGSERLPYAYGVPHGYRPQPGYGPTPSYVLAPYTYSLPRRYATHSPQHAFSSPAYGAVTKYAPAPFGYGPPSYAVGLPPSYGSNPEYGLPPRTFDQVPHAMPLDPNARLRAWNEITDSLTEALLEMRSAPSHGHSEFASRSATRPLSSLPADHSKH